MKKITLLLLLIPFFGFSQVFDFTNSDDGWNKLNHFTAETDSTFYHLMTVPGDGSLKNPSFGNEATGVNTEEVSWVGITIRNNDADGPTFMRVSYPKEGGGRFYANTEITAGDTDFVIYWLDLSNSNWVGIMDDIQVHFKASGNQDWILPETPVSIDIDKIEFAAQPSTTLQNEYYFDTDGDTEGFEAVNGEISGPTGGILTFAPHANKYAKLNQLYHHVDATTNKYVHVTLKNNSALNNQLRLVSTGLDGTKTMEISVNDDSFHTYTFDLTGEENWTGDQMFTIGIGSLEDGKAKDEGTAEFDEIIFDDAVGIYNNQETVEFSMYPNPANDHFVIESPNKVSSVVIFDITGKQVLRSDHLTNNRINISGLNPGVYLVKIEDEQNNPGTQRLVISR